MINRTGPAIGCSCTGLIVAIIKRGKVIIRGELEGNPDGTLHKVGAGCRMTPTTEGCLNGETGFGTVERSVASELGLPLSGIFVRSACKLPVARDIVLLARPQPTLDAT